MIAPNEKMQKLVSLCKQRGFIFQSSEIYGGLKSAYDYGPLGTELKRNIAQEWWHECVTRKENMVGMDASIMMHPKVWETSGHVSSFSDPLVDCHNCKERFRSDKAPKIEIGTEMTYLEGGKKNGKTLKGTATRDYVCPNCSSPNLSEERQFNGMFRSSIGPIDPIQDLAAEIQRLDKQTSTEELRKLIHDVISRSIVYLRPETAQGIFVQFNNVQQSMGMKVPFGIAQQGKAFRNEIVTEHFIFRSCEFEQMEIEFFCEPGTQGKWLEYWKNERMSWYHRLANDKSKFRLRQHAPEELAHYADNCYDIDYEFPWGFDELEGIASRTDYDLKKHGEGTGTKLSYFDPNKVDPQTGKMGYRYIPYVIEPSAGLTRATLCFLLDAMSVDEGIDAGGVKKERFFMKFHPRLAPYKAAILPLVKKDGQPELAEKLMQEFLDNKINSSLDVQQSIGKRYARHDEIGTPYCITIDNQSVMDQTVTIRDRDTSLQERISMEKCIEIVKNKLK